MAKVITDAQFREMTCKALRDMADRIEAEPELSATLERMTEDDDGSGFTHEMLRITVTRTL